MEQDVRSLEFHYWNPYNLCWQNKPRYYELVIRSLPKNDVLYNERFSKDSRDIYFEVHV